MNDKRKDDKVKGLPKKNEDAIAADAFIEAGEVESAGQILKERQSSTDQLGILRSGAMRAVNNLTAMAITFARAGDHEAAVDLLEEAGDMLREIRDNYQKKLSDPAMK